MSFIDRSAILAHRIEKSDTGTLQVPRSGTTSNEAPPQTGQICASATDCPEELVGLRRSFIGILDLGKLLRTDQVLFLGEAVEDSLPPLRGGSPNDFRVPPGGRDIASRVSAGGRTDESPRPVTDRRPKRSEPAAR